MSWFKKQTFRRFKEANLGVAGLIICGINRFSNCCVGALVTAHIVEPGYVDIGLCVSSLFASYTT